MPQLKQLVRTLSPATEFFIVVIGAFALPVWASIHYNIHGDPALALQISNEEVLLLVLQEMITLGCLAWFLSVRGWSAENFAAYPSWREIGEGLGLALASYAAWAVVWVVLSPAAAQVPAASSNLNWAAVLALCVINPLFEEVVLCAYMIPVLTRWRGTRTALKISLLVRLLFHTYQGLLGMLSVGIFGLFVSLFFARTRRLWPVVIAHALLDFAGLASN